MIESNFLTVFNVKNEFFSKIIMFNRYGPVYQVVYQRITKLLAQKYYNFFKKIEPVMKFDFDETFYMNQSFNERFSKPNHVVH